jgi:hypothetical protein
MINRDRPGLAITRKNEVGFLADMSQGIAHFDRVAVSDTDHLHGPQLKLFAKREPLYLYLAFCGFISRRDQNLARNWATGLLAISEGDFSAKADKKTYADIDTAIGEYFSTLPADAFLGNYDKDKGLMTLYSKGIQKRAGNLNS